MAVCVWKLWNEINGFQLLSKKINQMVEIPTIISSGKNKLFRKKYPLVIMVS